jgi:hypothetical protein
MGNGKADNEGIANEMNGQPLITDLSRREKTMRTTLEKSYGPTKSSRDNLPEQTNYADNGCEVSRSCLDCPLPRCKHDDPTWYQHYRRQGRDLAVVLAFRQERLSVFEVAQRFNVSPRTVHRAIRRVQSPMAVA